MLLRRGALLFFKVIHQIPRSHDLKQGKSEGFESCDRPVVRKRPIWVKIGDVLSRVTLKFDGWPWKTIGHLSFAVSSFVQHYIAIGEFKLELQSGNAQFGQIRRVSVRLSVRPTFLTMFPSSYHHEIFRSYYQWQKWCPCKRSDQRSRSQRSQPNLTVSGL